MLHLHRRWAVIDCDSAAALAKAVTAHTWTRCTAFRVTGTAYVFVNDAFTEDGAQEYGVLKALGDGRYVQVESITFSWCSAVHAYRHIQRVLAGADDEFAGPALTLRIEDRYTHGRCLHCA